MPMRDAQAVWLGDKLYVGGGWTPQTARDDARLYIHAPTPDTWSHIETPVFWFALITYHSQLVLVGGKELVGEYFPVTNKLWTLTEHGQWRETLPPMTKKHCHASAVEFSDNILVAGGVDDEGRKVNIVEVYNGHHWGEVQCLPKPCCDMKSTVLNGHWYLMGGEGQGKEVYYASLDSLVASCRLSEKPLPSVWKRLPDVPRAHSSTAVFGNRLIAVGGAYPAVLIDEYSQITIGGGVYSSPSSSIHAYSPHTQSWVRVGNMSLGLYCTCTAVLPTGDLMVIGGWRDAAIVSYVHKASLKFNGNSEL